MGTLALVVYLVLVALAHFGLDIPGTVLGIAAIVAAILLLLEGLKIWNPVVRP